VKHRYATAGALLFVWYGSAGQTLLDYVDNCPAFRDYRSAATAMPSMRQSVDQGLVNEGVKDFYSRMLEVLDVSGDDRHSVDPGRSGDQRVNDGQGPRVLLSSPG
jgi:hypothetical protein